MTDILYRLLKSFNHKCLTTHTNYRGIADVQVICGAASSHKICFEFAFTDRFNYFTYYKAILYHAFVF